MPDIEVGAVCQNWQAFHESLKEPRISETFYLYERGFNELFDTVDVSAFSKKYAAINLYEVLLVDKSHFKKKPGDYQLRYICAVGERFAELFSRWKPDYLFFPIIESVDAMMAYRMAEWFGIRPIIYCHARFSSMSFLSHSHLELLPGYINQIDSKETDFVWAREFLDRYRSAPGPFKFAQKFPSDCVYDDYREDTTAFWRLLRNVWLISGLEKHNQLISLWVRFQVYFQRIFVPVRNALFYMTERFVIRPEKIPDEEFDFFPLHFSPESSINTPAPYFIDQTRVVDRILLDKRSGNRTLVVKEHPAMYGFREKGFYLSLRHRPFVKFVHRKTPSFELIRRSTTVYSVTGTACLEAFFLGIGWVQYGANFLSAWKAERDAEGKSSTPEDFIIDVMKVSQDFVLYSPGRSEEYDQILFSKENVQKLSSQLQIHMSLDMAHRRVSRMDGGA